MLIHLLLFVQAPTVDGIQRFHDFMQRTKSFSVHIATKSEAIKMPGKGTILVVKPDRLRLTMLWGPYDYTYIKSSSQAIEYQKALRTYQEFPNEPGLTVGASPFAAVQEDSLPMVLLTGDIRKFAPAPFKLTKTENGKETYTATWKGRGDSGQVIAVIDAQGKLLHFDKLFVNPEGRTHLVQDFSDYVINPPVAKNAFATIPPAGFISYQMPLIQPQIAAGDALSFGRWSSGTGSVDLDPIARGKLVIVRGPDSPPADALLNYLSGKKLPVPSVTVSLGKSGGQYWSPPPMVSAKLSSIGTPLILLMSPQGKITGMWLGFDADKPDELITEITEALKEKEEEEKPYRKSGGGG